MTAQSGDDVILKIGNGASPTEVFTAVGGLRRTSFTMNNKVIESSNLGSGKWRKLISGAGIESAALSGSGYFTDSAAEEALRGHAFAATANNYELHFGNGDKLSGAFLVSRYSRVGDFGSQEDFAIDLESAGVVTFAVG
jgi:TP901-1 family phage major tail protein